MLEVEKIGKSFPTRHGEVRALVDASLNVRVGEFVSVQGPSGCGKSTLLLACGGLQRPDHGRVLLEGQDLYAISPDARAGVRARRIGFVFQRFHLAPYLSVLENVLAPSMALGEDGARTRAEELIERFGLADRKTHFPAQLSTGERQRTALARALLNRPGLLLADEPTGNLDPGNARVVLEWLGEFARSGGAVLLVTHDPNAAAYARRSVRMESGQTIAPPSALP